ncbi:GlxA family transcriptional regulator [uncultured Roseobacter sp.]|uniref:GlxA family transcriptional regulator n=1 Tax=uncultured Roseobacter sp. TaxID=114847 RepID=UPI00262DBDFB|nr:helix-turn-helix domain-containing protein [uncultured Roseobacter sp.]
MRKTTRIFFAVFDGFEPLDLSGPACVFQAANLQAEMPLYDVIPITPRGGLVRGSAGFAIDSKPSSNFSFGQDDFLIVVGAERDPLFSTAENSTYVSWFADLGRRCGRVGSVCSGAYVLACSGLADGHTISSHWGICAFLADRFPAVRINGDSIYTKDSNLWTSAGVTTGIDMALAILEEDHGPQLSAAVAKRMVVFSRRQGNQSQFSSFLEAQSRAASREVRGAVEWMLDNPAQDVSVGMLARIVGMTERTFYRKFEAAMGISPAKYLERMRLDLAKTLLEEGVVTKEVAGRVGFRSYSGFRVAFLRTFGLSPSAHQRLHARS